MLSVLDAIFAVPEPYRTPNRLNLIATGYGHYCVWFARGDDRKQYFEKSIQLLTESIEKDREQIGARSQLGSLLIEEKLVRNLGKGIELLNGLKSEGKLPDHRNSILSKALRQSGNLKTSENFNLCTFNDPSPAVFSEERKRFRALIKTYVAKNDTTNLERCLNEYYNLAILVYACYGDHDCKSGTIGWKYDAAQKIVSNICDKLDFNYKVTGLLKGGNYISARDWSAFKKYFGEVDHDTEFSQITGSLVSSDSLSDQ